MSGIRRSALVFPLLISLVMVLGGFAQEEGKPSYVSPNLSEVPFDRTKITNVEDDLLKQVVGQCTILVRNIVMTDATRAKMMAVARGLDPANELAKATDVILSQGVRPDPLNVVDKQQRQVSNQQIYSELHAVAGAIANRVDSRDGLMMSAMLLSALSDIENDPVMREHLVRFQQENNVSPPWDRILAGQAEVKLKGGLELKSRQARINALLVVPIGTQGQMAGQASRLTATYLKSGDGYHQRGLRFNQSVGQYMKGSLPEIANYMEVRHGDWIGEGVIEFAFQEKQSLKDGDSAGVACGLLLESLVTGTRMDEKFACTGALNVDGSVQPIGGVVAKLRGAHKVGCELVAIPFANRYALSDLTVLGEASILAKMQVFVVKEFEGALALAREDRTEEVESALTKFSGLQAQFAKEGVMNVLRTKEAQATLQEVLAAIPDHASARLMLSAAQGRLPKRLSLNGSMEEIGAALFEVFELVNPPPNLQPLLGAPLADFEATEKAMQKLVPKLEPRTQPIGTAMLQFSKACTAFRAAPRSDAAKRQQAYRQIRVSFERILTEMDKIADDPELIEDLIKL